MSEQAEFNFQQKSLNPGPRFKEALRQAVRNSGLSREQVVDDINTLARLEGITTNGNAKKLSTAMLDKWLSQSPDYEIPLKLVPIFCSVTNSIDPLVALAAPIDARVVNREDHQLLQWAKGEVKRRALVKRQKKLESEIGL